MLSEASGSGVDGVHGSLSYADLGADPFGYLNQLSDDGAIVIRTDRVDAVAAAFRTLDGVAAQVSLVAPDLDVDAPGTEFVVDTRSTSTPSTVKAAKGRVNTKWSLFSSGTTGAPKRVDHSLQSLVRTSAPRSERQLVWGCVYDPTRMAGVQVVLQGLVSGQPIVAVDRSQPINAQIQRLIDGGVNALSATPSLWRRLLQSPLSRELKLQQITLGGEIADQPVLDALTATFPDARVVHVFASTEASAAFSVSDGRAGFPLTYLADGPRGIALEVRDDRLFIEAPGASAAGADGFVDTGDLVEVVGDRVLFLGRESGLVNVGGDNVSPERVEEILRGHPDVADAIVVAKPNPMSGNVLTAKVQLNPCADQDGVSKRLRRHVRDAAPTSHVPAMVTVVDELGLASTGKVQR